MSSSIQISEEAVSALVAGRVAEQLSREEIHAMAEKRVTELVSVLTYEEAFKLLNLRGRNPQRSVREYCRARRIPVIDDGPVCGVRLARLIEHLEGREVKLSPRKKTVTLLEGGKAA